MVTAPAISAQRTCNVCEIARFEVNGSLRKVGALASTRSAWCNQRPAHLKPRIAARANGVCSHAADL